MTEDEIRDVTNIVRDEMRLAFDQQNEMIERLLTLIERHELELLHLRTENNS
jgi:hypothetical protein